GGVGRFAVQLARRGGAEVTGIASAERTDAVRRLGADATVRSADESDGEFDLILESVGGPSLASAIDRIAPGGVIVSIGNSSERETTFDPRALYRKNGATIHGLLIFDDVDSGRIGPRELRYLLELVETGELETSIGLQLGWSEFGVAIERLRDRAIEGKAVLKIG
ncbi:MAG: zinc-binding dehydrogenase, partial [Thermoanaerobaculia bacterium]|nr:zinc-binding dehydrogenase [Thermoanaerobaculia bacterium]